MGGSCDPNGKCITSQPTGTPKCNPQNYLDVGAGEDNATFGDNTLDGFIQGDIVDTNGQVIVNDTLLAITYQDLIPLMEKRVVGEILTCLKEYAAPTAPNNGRYPWAAKPAPSAAPNYNDDNGERFGRLPDGRIPGINLNDTKASIGPLAWDTWPNKDIEPTSNCKLTSSVSPNTWWLNWKELVFYSVAGGFQPAGGPPACGLTPNNCLTISPPSLAPDKQVVVIAAGKRLQTVAGGQPRTQNSDKADIRNYLEGDNATLLPPDDSFTVQPPSTTFNDVVCKQGIC